MTNIKCKFDELINSAKIIEHSRNANTHSERQIELLAKNIEHQGWRLPLIISKRSNMLVSGHGRLAAAKKLGCETIPVVFQDFESDAAEFQFLISDNKLAALAVHDDNLMIEGIKDLDLEDMDFELLGLDDFSLEYLEPVIKNTSAELNLDSFDNFQHQCPKCGFEWNDSGKDNS